MNFAGLDAPLRVVQPDVVRPLLDPVMGGWPFSAVPCDDPQAKPAFATIGPLDAKKWRLEAPRAAKPVADHNPVNAICDLVVEMSWERLRSSPDLLCLHAAALTFNDRLVIFPNARRAGKSLLSATLAHAGHEVFSDDFVPLAVDPQSGVISGMANGIAPRLRMPLPDNISASLNRWIMDRIGVRNKQYGYLTGIDLPRSGTTAPVGAIVVLEGDPTMTEPASLSPVSREDAMAALVTQNFGRQVHAGAILRVTDALTRTVPVLRLRYNSVEDAAALLHETPLLHYLPAAQMAEADQPGTLPLAPLALPDVRRDGPVDLARKFNKLPDYTECESETSLYLADGDGFAIQRLNPVSAIIWTLLDEGLTGVEMVEVMQELYSDIAVDRLRADVAGALEFLWQERLIVPTSER
ncbi:PqqD family protein [Loktanella sp. 5RATIMAR09]|uniref:PqqD family peptide modification chaperone n=1 Tax=Loktanella sp. 5RATIMAR09 TaxID=1225655 RepID=UPI00155E25E8|nr:PqqD family protein [Loktanella sp. 5RATIMAR09]